MTLDSSEKQEKCIKILNPIVGISILPSSIEGNFKNGKLKSISTIFWSQLDLKIEADTKNGFLHGMIRASQKGQKMIGYAERNQLSEFCWIISDKIIFSKCQNLFQPSRFVMIMNKNMNFFIHGKFDPQNPTLLDATDGTFSQGDEQENECFFVFKSKGIGTSYKLDLEKNIKIEELTKKDFCNGTKEVTENISEFIVNYMENLTPLPVDESSINLEKATKFLTKKDGKLKISLYSEFETTFKYLGPPNQDGNFNGYTLLELENGTLSGNFIKGELEGNVVFTAYNGQQVTYLPMKNGVVHGLVVTYGPEPLYTNQKKIPWYSIQIRYKDIAR